ncbi:uncharacterized protein LOC134679430 [Cydia fagiglandana]|uniref:uncharacterized protein LOC134679430 n=1 Tax=Cydia fagiglandana TaxID=1458189 RepID=UPI002FEE40C9
MESNQETNREMPDYDELPNVKNHIIIGKLDGNKSSPTDPSDLNKHFESSKGEDMDQCDCCDCEQSAYLEVPVSDKEKATCRGCVTKQHAHVNKNHTKFKEAFTQTDWSGIVLEVRPLENGSYEFHIPSLKALKMANSLY